MKPLDDAGTVLVQAEDQPISLPLADVLDDDDLRIFTVIGESDVTFALARMDGQVLVSQMTGIQVR